MVRDSILEQANAKRKTEYSSTTVNKYLFLEEGKRPLKSMFKRPLVALLLLNPTRSANENEV